MKFIATADLHLSLYSNDPIVQSSTLPERLHYLSIVLNEIASFAIISKIGHIVVAGDVYHTKSIIHALAQSVFLDFIRNYSTLEFIITNGNHDMSSRSGKGVSALKSLDNEPNVTLIHETQKIDNILFVPWNAETMIEDIKNGEADYLVAHLGLNEAELSSGISIISDIGMRDLKQYKHCFLGHYHKPQTLGNVTYMGSILQLDEGEKNEEKRFLVVDTSTGERKSIPTTGYKKYFNLEVTSGNYEEVIEQARKFKDEGHYVKLSRMSSDVNITSLEQEFRVVDKVEKDITNRGITTAMSTSDKLKKYIEIEEIPEDEREEYIKEAMDIIETCTVGG